MTNLDYLYNPAAAKPYFDKNHFVDKKLGFQIIENGTVLTYKDDGRGGLMGALGGIVDSEGKFIGSSYVMGTTADRKYTPPQSQLVTAPKPSFISDIFILFGDT